MKNKNKEIDIKITDDITKLKNNAIIFLKEKDHKGKHIEIPCLDNYSPFWMVHPNTGYTHMTIRAFNAESNDVEIIPWDEIHRIKSLNSADNTMKEMSKYIKEKEDYINTIEQNVLNEKRKKHDDISIN